jgi:hypothetical protein
MQPALDHDLLGFPKPYEYGLYRDFTVRSGIDTRTRNGNSHSGSYRKIVRKGPEEHSRGFKSPAHQVDFGPSWDGGRAESQYCRYTVWALSNIRYTSPVPIEDAAGMARAGIGLLETP